MSNWLTRYYEASFNNMLKPGKALLVFGPRQVGKTSLVVHCLNTFSGTCFKGSGEDLPLRELLMSQSVERYRSAFTGYNILFIDEAQKVPDIGNCLKLITDHMPEIQLIASGSSSFQLSSQIGEPLTGRHKAIKLFPLSIMELKADFGGVNILQQLENFLIYGTFPEVMTADNDIDRIEYLAGLRDSYMLKDILEFENLRAADKLFDLLRLLAFQIGQEVSLNELSNALGIAKQTVARYLDLLEKSFIIYKVRGFSRNLRKEITKTCRYYFLDNGLRNALINNFNAIKLRNDVGMLWENFLFIERLKWLAYTRTITHQFFWRTYDRQEIDLVEERGGRLYGYEFKWNPSKNIKPPKQWLNSYPEASFDVITRNNFLEFIA